MPAPDSLGHLQTREHKHVGERSNGAKRAKELAHAIMNSFGMEARKNTRNLTELDKTWWATHFLAKPHWKSWLLHNLLEGSKLRRERHLRRERKLRLRRVVVASQAK